jgi:hypothetical protein
MKINPINVSRAVNVSCSKFDHFRRARGRFLSQMTGRFYSKMFPGSEEDRKAAPLNLLYGAVTTLVPNLVYNDPHFAVRTDVLPYRQYGDILGLAINHLSKRIGLRSTLRKVITDALFMAGFMKTGIASSEEFITIEGVDVQIGQPYAERIDPDDMVLDPMARDWEEQAFMGHRFRVSMDDLMASGLYDEKVVQKLSSRYDSMDPGDGPAEKIIGDKSAQRFQEINRYVDLVEVYFPQEKVVVTLPYRRGDQQDAFLRVVDYEGPYRGQYHMLGFTYVPDNVLPVAPAGIWYDLHILGNRIARKLSRQAERLKQVLAYQGSAVEDANSIAESDDGETVRVDDINAIKEVKYGGTSNDAYTYMEWISKKFSEQAGNTDLLQGTSASAPTATQSEMLQANTNVRLSDMQALVYQFTGEVGGDLAFYLHTDPLIELPLARRVNGQDEQVVLSPDVRQGDWLDFHVHVEPFSMARQDPNTAVRRKLEFATNVIPAAAQAAQMLGPGFKIGEFLLRIAKDVGIEDADQFMNTPEFTAWTMMQMSQKMGVNPSKAAPYMQQAQPPGPSPAPPAMNPGQPNPAQMGPNGGISPQQEGNSAVQQAAPQPAGPA